MEFEEFKEKFKNHLSIINKTITYEQILKFYRYMELLLEWNEKINLTAITNPEDIILKHFIDSLTIEEYINKGESLVDVGTGAGFPGIPIKIYRDDINVTLVDSLNKRINFLNIVIEELKLEKIKAIHSRAEEFGKNVKYREKFDVSIARAVAALPVLAEYCLPYVKVGGMFIAMKGPGEDISQGESAVKTLGGEIADIKKYELPSGDKRVMVIVKKISSTPTKYPRNGGQISKKNL